MVLESIGHGNLRLSVATLKSHSSSWDYADDGLWELQADPLCGALADPLERSVAVIGWNCCVGIARAI